MRAKPASAWSMRGDSLLLALLDEDPSGVFAHMDRRSRWRYVSAVRELSEGCSATVFEVARAVLGLSRREAKREPGSLRAHVGYYLVGSGVAELRATIGDGRPRRVHLCGDLRRPTARRAYIPLWAVLAAVPVALALAYARRLHASPLMLVFIAAAVAAVMLSPAMQQARYWLARYVPHRPLPRMDFSGRIPDAWRTVVAIHCVVREATAMRRHIDLGRSLAEEADDPNLAVALLVDLPQAHRETLPGDAAVLAAAQERMQEITTGESRLQRRLFVLVRRRVWNEGEQAWIGWDRKRGKLQEFNRLLRDPSRKTSFAWTFGEFAEFVHEKPPVLGVTLDEDSWVSRDGIVHLVESAAHPLNHPVLDRTGRRVVAGYAILRPEMVLQPLRAACTRLQVAAALPLASPPPSMAGLLTARPRDFHFDVCGTAHFVGKGVYHIDCFRAMFDRPLPPEGVLTHDNVEGLHARVGYVRDVSCVEPMQCLLAKWVQENRWIRGNTQTLIWLLPTLKARGGERERNPLPLSSRLRLLPGLINQSSPLTRFVFTLLAWRWFPGSVAIWLIFSANLIPASMAWLTTVGQEVAFAIECRRAGAPMAYAAAGVLWTLRRAAWELLVVTPIFFVLLAQQAFVVLDGFVKGVWRVLCRKRLMQWRPQAEVGSQARGSLLVYLRAMAPSTAIASLLTAGSLKAGATPAAMLTFSSWAMAFALAWWLDGPAGRSPATPSPAAKGVRPEAVRGFAPARPVDHALRRSS